VLNYKQALLSACGDFARWPLPSHLHLPVTAGPEGVCLIQRTELPPTTISSIVKFFCGLQETQRAQTQTASLEHPLVSCHCRAASWRHRANQCMHKQTAGLSADFNPRWVTAKLAVAATP
jgi:hypothetical protein